jgi:hypothetical protein
LYRHKLYILGIVELSDNKVYKVYQMHQELSSAICHQYVSI